MNVSPRGLRAFHFRPASRRQRTDMVVLAHIKEQSRLSLGSYGRPRMTEELKEVGVDVGHLRVGWLMRENGIAVEPAGSRLPSPEPNQKWAGDISYIWTREGWLYLAMILDLHSRCVIGLAVSNRIKRDLAIRALRMAIALRASPRGCIFEEKWSGRCKGQSRIVL